MIPALFVTWDRIVETYYNNCSKSLAKLKRDRMLNVDKVSLACCTGARLL